MAPTPDVDIDSYTPSDFEACLIIFDSNVPDFFAKSEREGFARFLNSLPGPFWVVRDRSSSAVVGCGGLSMTDEGTTAWLRWGMVLAGRQRQGIGRRLIEVRLQWLGAQSTVRKMRVATTGRASGFFQRMGFELTSTEMDKYGPGLDRCDLEAGIQLLAQVRDGAFVLVPERGSALDQLRGLHREIWDGDIDAFLDEERDAWERPERS